MIKIAALTHLGMGRTEDGTLLARTLPGEEVEVIEPGVARILTPSPDRVRPPCSHFKACGGCAMQHASDESVANWKQNIVARALAAHGLQPELRPIATSPAQSRRRAKFSGKRTKKGAMVGFHARGSDVLVQVPNCKLLTPGLMRSILALEALTVLAASRKSEIALTVTDAPAGPDVLIETSQPLTAQLRIDLAKLAQSHSIARIAWNDEPVVTLQPPAQRFGVAEVVPPPGAFLQATREGEGALVQAVTEITGNAPKIIDLFAGSGTFTLPLAQKAEVHAVEGAGDMLDALDRGWRMAQGLKRVTHETRDLFRRPLEPDELNKFAAAVIDPPRAGAEAQIATLAQSDIKTVAMVACNPVTFARDAATLTGAGYDLNWLQVVDQFRWSTHVEVVASFTRA